ncbi:probable cytochrome P450 6a14 [Anastrepha obliqua]|uniref:probable cytochrome P450 6a14 n=1 Tax=Anastrepha obliqua TaxID=95512 RepID=UPI0024094F34|nr:probable cytochrome P450 6a14 [Anastrepha obliqua]
MAWRLALAISGILIPFSLIYSYYRHKLNYFEHRGLPYVAADILPSQRNSKHLLRSAYNHFKASTPIAGIFLHTTPAIVILDLELVKRVLIDDFSNFSDRLSNQSLNKDFLYSLDNTEWQALRRKLTPCFWSAKMGFIFPRVIRAAECLVANADAVLPRERHTIDLQMLCTRYATDALVSCVFGVELDGADESVEALRWHINELLTRECQTRFSANLMMTNTSLCWAKCTHAQVVSPNLSAHLADVVQKVLEQRRTHKTKRNDILQILIVMLSDEQNDRSEANEADNERKAMELVKQSFATLLTGFANTATVLAHCLHELACNVEIQRQLRQNIVSVLQNYELEFSYEAMGHMYYLDQVVAETLRKHPVTEMLMRHTLSDYPVPGSAYAIERGTCVLIPVHAIHHDPTVYPSPEQFDPARFEAAAVMARHACAYLPYDDGPRNCLGKRLSKMLIKVALVALLRIYKVEEDAEHAEKSPTDSEAVAVSHRAIRIQMQRI